jgi:hypothetical protein
VAPELRIGRSENFGVESRGEIEGKVVGGRRREIASLERKRGPRRRYLREGAACRGGWFCLLTGKVPCVHLLFSLSSHRVDMITKIKSGRVEVFRGGRLVATCVILIGPCPKHKNLPNK